MSKRHVGMISFLLLHWSILRAFPTLWSETSLMSRHHAALGFYFTSHASSMPEADCEKQEGLYAVSVDLDFRLEWRRVPRRSNETIPRMLPTPRCRM